MLPSVRDENIIYMAQPIAAWQGAVRQFLLVQFPGERGPIEGILLLSLGSQGTAGRSAVWSVFTWYVTLAITSYYRTSRETQQRCHQLWKRQTQFHTIQETSHEITVWKDATTHSKTALLAILVIMIHRHQARRFSCIISQYSLQTHWVDGGIIPLCR